MYHSLNEQDAKTPFYLPMSQDNTFFFIRCLNAFVYLQGTGAEGEGGREREEFIINNRHSSLRYLSKGSVLRPH